MFYKSWSLVLFLGFIALLGLLPEKTWAFQPGGKVCLFGNIGYGNHAMGDVNLGVIKDGNNFLEMLSYWGWHSHPMPDLQQGLLYGGGILVGLSDHILLGIEVEEINLITEGKATYSDDYNNQGVYSLQLRMPALAIGGLLKITKPVGEALLLSLGLGLNYLSVYGSLTQEANFNSQRVFYSQTYIHGKGMGGKIMLGIDLFLADSPLALGFEGGYRVALAPDLKNEDEETLKNNEEKNIWAEYSGMFFRGGLRIFL